MSIDSVKFRGRHASVKALISLLTGIAVVILLIVLSIVAAVKDGIGIPAAATAFCAMLVSVAGFVVSARATRERDIFMSVPIAGMTVNGIAFLAYIIIYVIGLV